MSVKDHSTGLVYVVALPCKHPNYITYELEKNFRLVGYPSIFHTDYGNEFTANVVLKFLKNNNPSILIVTGHLCTPRDQGSVESVNKLVKRILADVMLEHWRNNLSDNWTYILGQVVSCANNQRSRQKNSVPSYNAVFGMDFHKAT